jgi:hypothetical protein
MYTPAAISGPGGVEVGEQAAKRNPEKAKNKT